MLQHDLQKLRSFFIQKILLQVEKEIFKRIDIDSHYHLLLSIFSLGTNTV